MAKRDYYEVLGLKKGASPEEIKKALQADVQEELTHAQTLARRMKTIGGKVPGSAGFKSAQQTLQPNGDTTDVVSVIKGVIDAEDAAIAQYNKLIKLCDGVERNGGKTYSNGIFRSFYCPPARDDPGAGKSI